MRKWFLMIGISLACLLILAPALSAQSVVSRARIGGYTEATTFISNGTNSNRIALMDGYEVLSMPIKVGAKATKLFSVLDLPIDAAPRGIAWVASEKLFAFADNFHPDMLIFSDQKGRPAGTRTLVYPAGDPYRANRFEGLVYIPQTSTVFPDHIAAVTFCQPNTLPYPCEPYQIRVLVIRRDGLVVKEINPILPQEVIDNVGEFWGIGFQTPNILLCGGGPYLWKMDFNGNPVSVPVYSPDQMVAEGVTQLPNGYVAATASAAGKLLFFDSNLNRVAQFDQTYTIGLSISGPAGLAWNNNAKNFLISEVNNEQAVWSVPRSLKTKTRVVNLANVILPDPQGENPLLNAFRFRKMIYLSGEIVMTYTNAGAPGIPGGRARIVSFDMAGNLVGYQRLFDWNLNPAQVSVGTFTYIPPPGSGLGQYVLRGITASPSVVLDLIWPTDGTLAGTIDLAATGLLGFGSTEFFNPAHPTGGQFLVFGNGYRAVVTDFNGNPISEFNFRDKLRTLGAVDLAYITNGPNAGAFAMIDPANSELIIFSLP